jgi:hypothetical protein
MRQERWPDVSEEEWKKIKSELLEEMKDHGF